MDFKLLLAVSRGSVGAELFEPRVVLNDTRVDWSLYKGGGRGAGADMSRHRIALIVVARIQGCWSLPCLLFCFFPLPNLTGSKLLLLTDKLGLSLLIFVGEVIVYWIPSCQTWRSRACSHLRAICEHFSSRLPLLHIEQTRNKKCLKMWSHVKKVPICIGLKVCKETRSGHLSYLGELTAKMQARAIIRSEYIAIFNLIVRMMLHVRETMQVGYWAARECAAHS